MRPQWSKKTPVLRSGAAARRAATPKHPPTAPTPTPTRNNPLFTLPDILCPYS